MGKIKDMTGEKFGNLQIIEFAGLDSDNKALWLCRCDCGTEKVVPGKCLRSGSIKSCGCLKSKIAIQRNTTHGACRTKLYNSWRGMKERCLNPNSEAYRHYGARGITICSAWLDFTAFKDWALANGYSDGLSIERLDVNRNYCPDNCAWIPLSEQGVNKRSTKWITVNGATNTMSGWAREIGVEIQTIFLAERNGIDIPQYIGWKLDNPGKRYPNVSGLKNI